MSTKDAVRKERDTFKELGEILAGKLRIERKYSHSLKVERDAAQARCAELEKLIQALKGVVHDLTYTLSNSDLRDDQFCRQHSAVKAQKVIDQIALLTPTQQASAPEGYANINGKLVHLDSAFSELNDELSRAEHITGADLATRIGSAPPEEKLKDWPRFEAGYNDERP